jgi:hypothetical protein
VSNKSEVAASAFELCLSADFLLAKFDTIIVLSFYKRTSDKSPKPPFTNKNSSGTVLATRFVKKLRNSHLAFK